MYVFLFPYLGKQVRVEVNFAKDFPAKAPLITFVTKMYHTAICGDAGTICQNTIVWNNSGA